MINEDKIHEIVLRAREVLVHDEALQPRALAFGEFSDLDGKQDAMMVLLPKPALLNLRKAAFSIGYHMPNATDVVFICESYYVDFDPDDLRTLDPSNHPDRQEAILLFVAQSSGEYEVYVDRFESTEDDEGNHFFEFSEPERAKLAHSRDPLLNMKSGFIEPFMAGSEQGAKEAPAPWN